MASAKWTIEAVNQRLKDGKVGVTVCLRGDRLSLWATFPPKPDSGKANWYQQHLSLGIYGNPFVYNKAKIADWLLNQYYGNPTPFPEIVFTTQPSPSQLFATVPHPALEVPQIVAYTPG